MIVWVDIDKKIHGAIIKETNKINVLVVYNVFS